MQFIHLGPGIILGQKLRNTQDPPLTGDELSEIPMFAFDKEHVHLVNRDDEVVIDYLTNYRIKFV